MIRVNTAALLSVIACSTLIACSDPGGSELVSGTPHGTATGTAAGTGAATGTAAGTATGASDGAATGSAAGTATGAAEGTATGGTSTGGAATGDAAGTGTATGTATGTPLPDNAVWANAELTWYTSYPDPGSDECIIYNGCMWAGYFAGVQGQQTEEWVQSHNIIAIHEDDFEKYKLKTFRLRQGTKEIDAVVYDMCSDSDCNGCCTANAQPSGFLIDVEENTKERFGSGSGTVEWTCLDCE